MGAVIQLDIQKADLGGRAHGRANMAKSTQRHPDFGAWQMHGRYVLRLKAQRKRLGALPLNRRLTKICSMCTVLPGSAGTCRS